jgi:hypothetical protein
LRPLAKKALDALRELALKEQGASPPEGEIQGSLPLPSSSGRGDQYETAGGPGPLFGESIDGAVPVVPAEGRAKKAKMAPVKIFSKLFNEEIWLVADQEEMAAMVSKGVKEPIYMAWEIPVLRGKDKESLKAVHATKKVFPGSALA